MMCCSSMDANCHTMQLEDYATLEATSQTRTGLPEVVWGPGKTPDQVASIMQALVQHQRVAIATRVEPEMYAAVRKLVQGTVVLIFLSCTRIMAPWKNPHVT